MDSHDHHIRTMEACGKAFGFVLRAALADVASGKASSPGAFFDSLASLFEADHFSPDVGLVVSGILDGARAFPGASRKISQGDEIV